MSIGFDVCIFSAAGKGSVGCPILWIISICGVELSKVNTASQHAVSSPVGPASDQLEQSEAVIRDAQGRDLEEGGVGLKEIEAKRRVEDRIMEVGKVIGLSFRDIEDEVRRLLWHLEKKEQGSTLGCKESTQKKAKGKRELINPVNYDKGANLKMGFGADGAGELRRYGKEGAVGLS